MEAELPAVAGFQVEAVGIDDDGAVVAQASGLTGPVWKPVVTRCS